MGDYAFGVDVGGTTIKIGLFTVEGEKESTWEIKTRTENNGELILPDIAKEIDKKMTKNELSKENIVGIGIGVPGPVNGKGDVLKCVNLGWGIFNVEKKLEELTGLKARAGNDANIAALGEMWMGGGKGYKNVVMVTLGTGIGGGIVLDEKILAGINGAAGEIGHIHVRDDEKEICGCGNRGCLEQYASASGLVRVAKRYFDENPGVKSRLLDRDKYTSKEIFDEAKNRDGAALRIVEEEGRILGTALAGVACVVNPEVFVIGGGMSKAGKILIDAIKKYYKQNAFHASRDTKFALATLGNDAGMYGCVKMVIE